MTDTASPPPTDEDRLSASRRLLLSSPPGQFDLILADLRNIQKSSDPNAESLLSDEWADGVREEYERITRRDCLNNDENGRDEGSDLEKALRESLAKYMSDHYGGSGGGGGSRSGGDEGAKKEGGASKRSNFVVQSSSDGEGSATTIIRTYAENVDLRNYGAGSWSAEYRITSSDGSNDNNEMEMEGTVDVVAHAFENGNVQMRSSIPLGPATVAHESSSSEATARAIVDQIQKWEDEDVQGGLGKMYDSVNDTMLKSLRRVMPVTRTRMDWRNLGGHRLVKTMAEREKEMAAEGKE